VLIIRRVNCINTTSGVCHCLKETVWYAGLDGTCIPHGHLHKETYTVGRIDAIDSPDDEHLVDRNMWRIGINKCKKKELCFQVGYLQSRWYFRRLKRVYSKGSIEFQLKVLECAHWRRASFEGLIMPMS